MNAHSVLERHQAVSEFMQNNEGENREKKNQTKKKMTKAAARLDAPVKHHPEQKDSKRGVNSHRDAVKCEDGV